MTAARYTVTVAAYSLATGDVGRDCGPVYVSDHRSARAAARRLAEMINRRTERARRALRYVSPGRGLRYTVREGDGPAMALIPFRAKHGIRP